MIGARRGPKGAPAPRPSQQCGQPGRPGLGTSQPGPQRGRVAPPERGPPGAQQRQSHPRPHQGIPAPAPRSAQEGADEHQPGDQVGAAPGGDDGRRPGHRGPHQEGRPGVELLDEGDEVPGGCLITVTAEGRRTVTVPAQIYCDDAESCCAQGLSERVVHIPHITHGRGADHQGHTLTGGSEGRRAHCRACFLGRYSNRSTTPSPGSISPRLMNFVGDGSIGYLKLANGHS